MGAGANPEEREDDDDVFVVFRASAVLVREGVRYSEDELSGAAGV